MIAADTSTWIAFLEGEPGEDTQTLDKALRLPNGIFDTISQIDPAMIGIVDTNKLIIPAYAGPTQPKYAKPVIAPVGADPDSGS